MSTKEFVELQKTNMKLQEHVLRQYSEYKDELNALQKENHELKRLLQMEKQKGAEIFQQFQERIRKMEQDLEEINYSPPISPTTIKNTNSRPLNRSRQIFEQLEEEGKRIEEETRRVFEFCRKPVEFYIPASAPPPPPPAQTIPQQAYQYIPIQIPQYTQPPMQNQFEYKPPSPTIPPKQSPPPTFTQNVNILNNDIEQMQASPISSPRANSPSNKMIFSPNSSQIPSVSSPHVSSPQTDGSNKISDVNFIPETDSEEEESSEFKNEEIPSSAFAKMTTDTKSTSSKTSETRTVSETLPISENKKRENSNTPSLKTNPPNANESKKSTTSMPQSAKTAPPPAKPVLPIKTAPPPKEEEEKPFDPMGGFSTDSSELNIEIQSFVMENQDTDQW